MSAKFTGLKYNSYKKCSTSFDMKSLSKNSNNKYIDNGIYMEILSKISSYKFQ